MTLTLGAGPFAHPDQAGERFNFPVDSPGHVLYFEDSPRRVRVAFGGEVVGDSQSAKMLHETGHLPVYYLPRTDVRMDLLTASDHHTHCPFKGEASWWTVRVGEREAENAVWSYPQPIKTAPSLAGYFAFDFDAMDAWFEEDEQILGHPRDPYHRVDVRQSTRRLTLRIGGEAVAQTHRALLLFETGLPTRYYIPRSDVRNDLLVASIKRTLCPYKGRARYWSVRTSAGVVDNLAWCYDQPLPEAWKIAGCVCFAQESDGVELDLDRGGL